LTREEILRDLVDHHQPQESKVLSRQHLLAEVHRRRLAGQTVVFTNGCFDLLHPGHVRLLREAAGMGDFLVVGLNSDASVRRLKGPSRPLNPALARAEVLSALEAVDAVTVFDEDTPLELITAIRPDVLVKGGDYRPEQVVGRAEVSEAGGRLVLVPLVEGHSTTTMVRRARERGRTPHAAEPALAPHVARVAPAVRSAINHESRG
jgi:D-beta-D-heptose 7-phosphate kinase/D-beta-D-heptose 1-phosphate adenosyltransferase